MSIRAAILVLAVLIAHALPAQAQIQLDARTIDFLEGNWRIITGPTPLDACVDYGFQYPEGTDLSSLPDTNGQSFNIEFRRSGGTVMFADTVDFADTAQVRRAQRIGDEIRLTLRFHRDDPLQTVRLRVLSPDRISMVEAVTPEVPHYGPGVMHRCGRPRRDLTTAIARAWVERLSWTQGRYVYFVSDAPRPYVRALRCGDFQDSYRFHLIGPVDFYVWDPAGQWNVSRATRSPDGALVLDLEAGSPRPRLTLRMLANGRLSIAEPNLNLLRCED